MIDRRNFLNGVLGLLSANAVPRLSLARTAPAEFRLTASEVRKSIYKNTFSPLWLYNHSNPGPEIRIKKGQQVRVDFTNNQVEPTSIHWHGIRIDNAMDGVSGLTQKPVQPGETFTYQFIPPDAGTFWYHAHTSSMEQVARGLYGPLIVEETISEERNIRDIVVILDDWWLDEQGGFQDGFENYLQGKQGGRIGNVITVNGKPPGETKAIATGEIYRLRLINAANSRIFTLRLNAPEIKLVALDGINLQNAEGLSDLFSLAPAQRADFLVSTVHGESIELLDGDGLLQTSEDQSSPRKLLQLIPDGRNTQSAYLPNLSSPDLPFPNLSAALKVKLTMEGGSISALGKAIYQGKVLDRDGLANEQQVWTFNGIASLGETPLFRVERGMSVIIEVENKTGWKHAMHLHGHHFKFGPDIASIATSPWRDTVLMERWEKGMMCFVADNPGKWLLHCHMLQHAQAGMNTWFEIS